MTTEILSSEPKELAFAVRTLLEESGHRDAAEIQAMVDQCTAILNGESALITPLAKQIWASPPLRGMARQTYSLISGLRAHAQPIALDALTDLVYASISSSRLASYITVHGNRLWIPDLLVRSCLPELEVSSSGHVPNMASDPSIAEMMHHANGFNGWVRSWIGWVSRAAESTVATPPERSWAHVPGYLGAYITTGIPRTDRSQRLFDAVASRPTEMVYLADAPHATAWLPDPVLTHDHLRLTSEPSALNVSAGLNCVAALGPRLGSPHASTAWRSLLASHIHGPRRSPRRALWDFLTDVAASRLWCGTIATDGVWTLEINPQITRPYSMFRWRDRWVISSTMPSALCVSLGLQPALVRSQQQDFTSLDLHGLMRTGWRQFLEIADPVKPETTTTDPHPWFILPGEYAPPEALPMVRFGLTMVPWSSLPDFANTPCPDEI